MRRPSSGMARAEINAPRKFAHNPGRQRHATKSGAQDGYRLAHKKRYPIMPATINTSAAAGGRGPNNDVESLEHAPR